MASRSNKNPKYYLISSPPMKYAYPEFPDNKVVNTEDFDGQRFIPALNLKAWGTVEYKRPIPKKYLRYYLMAQAPVEK